MTCHSPMSQRLRLRFHLLSWYSVDIRGCRRSRKMRRRKRQRKKRRMRSRRIRKKRRGGGEVEGVPEKEGGVRLVRSPTTPCTCPLLLPHGDIKYCLFLCPLTDRFIMFLHSSRTPMMEVENFTIFIKNSIRFPLFNYTKWGNADLDIQTAPAG